ncbi:MbtH family protein [Roseateles sp.]|uniref:MbtH family protein n=1 Tax=Roseateles sp. TaxID=1971397 RepID=UPI003D0B33B4
MESDQFIVVINAEGQYSLWPAGRPVPAGWEARTGAGTKAESLAYVDAHWTDMTPASLRGMSSASTAAS